MYAVVVELNAFAGVIEVVPNVTVPFSVEPAFVVEIETVPFDAAEVETLNVVVPAVLKTKQSPLTLVVIPVLAATTPSVPLPGGFQGQLEKRNLYRIVF